MSKYYKTNNNSTASGGIGILGVLQIVFVVLKCLDLVDWSWWVVLIPTFVSIGLFIIAVAIILITYKDILLEVRKNDHI